MSDSFAESGRRTSPPTARAVLVVGSGRSGASDLARALQLLGLRVPLHGVGVADSAGSSTPVDSPWIAEFHDRLLRRVNVAVADARPQAWFETGKLATQDEVRLELFEWLEAESVRTSSEMLIADPRLVWFLGLWKAASARSEVETSYAVMLRHPGDAIGATSKQGSGPASEISRAAAWINQALHAERATRGSRRAFVPHDLLLEDWTVQLYRLGEQVRARQRAQCHAREIRRVHDLIDSRPPTAVGTPWSDVDLPQPLRSLIDETWDQLKALAGAEVESADAHASLDELRHEYAQLYADAERLAHSTIVAARRRTKPPRRDEAGASGRAEAVAEEKPQRRWLERWAKT